MSLADMHRRAALAGARASDALADAHRAMADVCRAEGHRPDADSHLAQAAAAERVAVSYREAAQACS